MNATRDPETILAAWLDEGPTDLPDATRRAIVAALPTTTQARRGPLAPWRLLPMNSFSRAALAVLVAALALGAALYVVAPRLGVGGPVPTPTATPLPPTPSPALPTPLPTLSLDTGTWTPFTSTRYGFSVAYPEGWTATLASRDFVLESDRTSSDVEVSELFIDQRVPGSAQILLSAFAATVPGGTPETTWIDAYQAPEAGDTSGCKQLSAQMTPLVVDGQPALLSTNCNWYTAFAFVGSRMYVFTVWRPDQRALTEAFLSTVQLP